MRGILETLSCAAYPGKYRLYRGLLAAGFLSGAVHHKVGPYSCIVPADQFEFWRICGPQNYQQRRLRRFSDILNELNDGFAFLDLGADVGAVCVQIKRMCARVNEIVAFEPNPKCFVFLKQNLENLNIRAQAVNAAVSNFDGFSMFSFDHNKNSDHAGHLDNSGTAQVRVVRVDSVCQRDMINVAMKIDIEGAEKAALDGARHIIAHARFVGIFIEIHPEVLKRTKIAVEEIFDVAEQIRPFRWLMPEDGLPDIDRKRKFFDQFPDDRQYDVIGITRS
jgi:FkbM family methyltransferase